MQIKIEIDVKPEELRRFLGLPDVAGLQEEVINFLRDKVSDANERFDPTEFVKANIDSLRGNKAFQRFLYGSQDAETEAGSSPPRGRRKTSAARKTSSKRSKS